MQKPKAREVDEEQPRRGSTETPCRSCGSEEGRPSQRELQEQAATFQVIVACAACGARFAALSRN